MVVKTLASKQRKQLNAAFIIIMKRTEQLLIWDYISKSGSSLLKAILHLERLCQISFYPNIYLNHKMDINQITSTFKKDLLVLTDAADEDEIITYFETILDFDKFDATDSKSTKKEYAKMFFNRLNAE